MKLHASAGSISGEVFNPAIRDGQRIEVDGHRGTIRLLPDLEVEYRPFRA